MAAVKIVSLLPSATEIVFALGLGPQLEGVTFECDHPAEARSLPRITGTALDTGPDVTPAQIDAQVSALVAAGQQVYTLDETRIRGIDPDVIISQDLCRVCAVDSGAVQDALDVLGCHAEVVSLDPHRLDEVIGCVGLVGRATGSTDRADQLMGELRRRVDDVRRQVAGCTRPTVLALEWADPPFNAGHWVPDMIEAAGGRSLLTGVGEPSRRLTWEEVAATDIDLVLFMPCGFDLAGVVDQVAPVLDRPELARVGAFYAVDANAYFSRPGPRVVDGVERLAELLHGEHVPSDLAVRLR